MRNFASIATRIRQKFFEHLDCRMRFGVLANPMGGEKQGT
jgi:hypothetical protein